MAATPLSFKSQGRKLANQPCTHLYCLFVFTSVHCAHINVLCSSAAMSASPSMTNSSSWLELLGSSQLGYTSLELSCLTINTEVCLQIHGGQDIKNSKCMWHPRGTVHHQKQSQSWKQSAVIPCKPFYLHLRNLIKPIKSITGTWVPTVSYCLICAAPQCLTHPLHFLYQWHY